MSDQLNLLYTQIKKQKISHEDALKQILKIQRNQKITPHNHKGQASDAKKEHHLVQEANESLLSQNKNGEVTFVKHFTYNENLLKDHRIFGDQFLMGVAHCSLVLQTLAKISVKGDVTLSNVIFLDAVRFSPLETIRVDVVLKRQNNPILFENQYFKQSIQKKITTARGQIVFNDMGSLLDERIAISDWTSGAIVTIPGEVFYQAAAQEIYGNTLFSVKKVHVLEQAVLSEIELTSEMKEEAKDYSCHPAVFDAIHVTSSFVIDPDNPLIHHWVPFVIKKLQIRQPVSEDILGKLYCYARLAGSNSEIKEFDCRLYNEQGRLIINIEGFCTKRVPSKEVLLGISSEAVIAVEEENQSFELTNNTMAPVKEKIQEYIKRKIKELFVKPGKEIEMNKNFMDMGVDSRIMISASQKMEEEIGIVLLPTLFFEYQNIEELSNYFAEKHADQFAAYFGVKQSIEPISSPESTQNVHESISIQKQQADLPKFTPSNPQFYSQDDIAIIGMDGRLAQSPDLRSFWKHIRNSKDLISEIPQSHWDYRPWFDENRNADNKTYSKWGSFLEEVDQFDPLFFGISPRLANWMDPQVRILLEVVYGVLEDAGYANQIKGSKTGMYTGVCFQEYWDEIVRKRIPITSYEQISSAMSFLSSQISYTFDLQGPSIPLDNACASSLTAMHLACQALKIGECDLALVAGINLLLSPLHYVYFSRQQALSPTGRCHTFDKQADGYVPGEGIVAVLLKPLSKAIRDQDNIHAVVKGTAINHGGRSNNPTSPRPELQTKVLLEAWKNAGITPETLSYIECHGTGTTLGDPIEISALQKAFRKHTKRTNFCAIGSTKAHIGHLEGAAGLSSVIKVVLSMKHQTIPKMPNFKELNPIIQLEDSPLYINTEVQEWKTEGNIPRLAGVSSFGMTGNNAHVVIQEYIPKDQKQSQISTTAQKPAIIVLSAKNRDRLKEQVRRLLAAIQEQQYSDTRLADMAYTLQVGREAMEERLAIIVGSIKELEEKLKSFVEGRDGIPDLYQGQVKHNKETLALFAADEDLQKAIDAWIVKRKYAKLLDLWAKGLTFDWNKLYGEIKPRRISLPTYPFARERYWMPEKDSKSGSGSITATTAMAASIQPLQTFQVKLQASTSRHSSQPKNGTEPKVSNVYEKPSGVSLRSLSDDQILSGKPVGQTQQSATLSSTDISLSQSVIKDESKPVLHVHEAIPLELLREGLTISLAEVLNMNQSDIDVDDKFVDMGLDSITGVEWIQTINKQYGTSIPATKVYDYPSIYELAVFLEKELGKQKRGLNQTPVRSIPSLSFDDILQQVQSGALGAEQADQLLSNSFFKEE